jgi:cation transport regulator ChaC
VSGPEGHAGAAGAAEPALWYFGYGSNVERGTFVERRGMRPLGVQRGLLEDWELCFDLPVGPGERAVANLRARRGARVWGVLWRIELRDAARLDRSEGVHRGFYRRLAVRVQAEEERVDAFTYLSDLRRPGRKPSARYLGLLLAGARQHGLPAEWVEGLERIELAVDERDAQAGLF